MSLKLNNLLHLRARVVARGLPCKRGGEHFPGQTASVVTIHGSEQLLRPPALMHDTRNWYVVPGVRWSHTNSVSDPVYTVSKPEMIKQKLVFTYLFL